MAAHAPHLSLMAGNPGPPPPPRGQPKATASGPPRAETAKPAAPAPRAVDPLSGRAPWDYEPVAKSLENVEEAELAPLSRFIEAMGAGWAIIPGVLWLLAALVPIIIMKFGIEASGVVFWGSMVVPYLLVQVWAYLDIQDRGSPMWWLAVIFVVPVGIWLYFMIERQE
ncbi:MAG TPA: hypothetical protein PLD23_03285 [Armatimonadota bacterium]|nr:hypothetical protein [Armatimonadota bacterium]HQK92498.1 hypothetical protein [Armatimonadota bacterium]